MVKKKRQKLKKDKNDKSHGPQGPVSNGAYDAVSPKNKKNSFVLGTSTNRSPSIKGLTPMPKGAKPIGSKSKKRR